VSGPQLDKYLGPSLARAPKSFRAEFGDDETLLATVDKLLEGVLRTQARLIKEGVL
jgi:hypothetical protein